jgi:hypothetical protein
MDKASSSFLKKRTKKLLLLWGMGAMAPTPQAQSHKSLFGSRPAAAFSSEKELLCLDFSL